MEARALERLNAELEEEQERLRYLQGLFQGEAMPDMLDDARRLSVLRRLSLGGAWGERYCEDCGEPIPLSRILAAPECVCCRDCQAMREGEAEREVED